MTAQTQISSRPPVESTSPHRLTALAAFCASAALLIGLHSMALGSLCWVVALRFALRDSDLAFRRRMAVLLGTVGILAFSPIGTDTSNRHFLELGIPFLLVILLPALILSRTDPGVLGFRLWPRRFRWQDLSYVLISIPLSWLAFEIYFRVNPDVPIHWVLPAEPNSEANWRLLVGINGVGIWGGLFFINTVFAVLRSVFPYRLATLGQAVVYTAVLYQMAFTGIGPFLVFTLALTQGAIFEKSDSLLYVILVHLIVNVFLLAGIFGFYYPEGGFLLL